MAKPNYTILYQDEQSKNVILRITDTEAKGMLLDVVFDEWPSDGDVNAKLERDVAMLKEIEPQHFDPDNPQDEEGL